MQKPLVVLYIYIYIYILDSDTRRAGWVRRGELHHQTRRSLRRDSESHFYYGRCTAPLSRLPHWHFNTPFPRYLAGWSRWPWAPDWHPHSSAQGRAAHRYPPLCCTQLRGWTPLILHAGEMKHIRSSRPCSVSYHQSWIRFCQIVLDCWCGETACVIGVKERRWGNLKLSRDIVCIEHLGCTGLRYGCAAGAPVMFCQDPPSAVYLSAANIAAHTIRARQTVLVVDLSDLIWEMMLGRKK